MRTPHLWGAVPIGLLLLSTLADAVAVSADAPTEPIAATADAVPDPVAVDWLVERARRSAPLLAASIASAERIDAAARQAGRWDDPDVQVEAGRFRADGVGEKRGRIGVSQRLPLFGSKSRARQAAAAAGPILAAERRELELDLTSEVRRAAANVVGATRRGTLAADSLELSRALLRVVESRLGANKAQQVDRLRAEVDVVEAETAKDRADLDRYAAVARLGRLVGVALRPDHGVAAPDLQTARELDQAISAADQHPAIARAQALVAASQAELALAKATGRPDVVLGVFGEREGPANGIGVAAGMSIPLWNANRAGAESAAAATRVATAELAQQRRVIVAGIDAAWRANDLAVRRERAIRERLLPSAQQALQLAQASYGAGGEDLAAVLDARRTLARIGAEAADAAAAVTLTRIDLDRAIGTEISP